MKLTLSAHHVSPHPVCGSCSVASDSLRPHGLQPARFLCPWDSPCRGLNASQSPAGRQPQITDHRPGPCEQEKARLPAGSSCGCHPGGLSVDRLLDPFLGGLGLHSKSSATGIALNTPLGLDFTARDWAGQGRHEGRRGWPGPDHGPWS